LVLGELDLKLALEGRRALREDIEDQPVAVEHARLQAVLEIALLARGKRPADENQLGTGIAHSLRELFDLALADEVAGVGPVAPSPKLRDDLRARRFGECAEFLSLVFLA